MNKENVKMEWLERTKKWKREEFYSHIRSEIINLSKRKEKITIDEWNNLRINSYERRILYNNLTNEVLIETAEYYMSQCYQKLPSLSIPIHYNEALERVLLPLLLERFKKTAKKEKQND